MKTLKTTITILGTDREREIFKGKCNHCRKIGHKEADCWRKHPEKKSAKFQKSGETSGANTKVLVVNVAKVPDKA